MIYSQKSDAAYLLDPSGYAGVSGLYRLKPTGENERALQIVQLTGNGTTQIVRAAAALLPQSGDKQSSLYLELAVHAENNRPALRRRSFRQFMTGLNAVNSGCGAYPEFRGMAFDSFAGLEDIWEK